MIAVPGFLTPPAWAGLGKHQEGKQETLAVDGVSEMLRGCYAADGERSVRSLPDGRDRFRPKPEM